MRTKIVWLLTLAALGLVVATPAAAALPPAVDGDLPECEDVLDEDYCNGPEGTCRSILSDSLCNVVFDPTRIITERSYPTYPVCEDVLDEDYCNGPEGTCRSILSDAICDNLFDPTRIIQGVVNI